MSKTTAPKIPGAAPEVAATAQDEPTAAPEVAAGETVAVPKAQLDALLARVAALEGATQRHVSKQANREANLPEQDAINLAELKTPVLTKQGWLVPETFGSHPNAKP